MAFTRTYGEQFRFADYVVDVEFETLPGEAEASIRDLIRKNEFGRAQIVLLGAAIKKLTVGDQKIIKPQPRSVRRGTAVNANADTGENLPALYDRETWESLTDKLLRMVVAEEFWIAMKEPFATAFAEFVDWDETPEADPTKSHSGTSTQES